jgi:hypothetical protein
VVVLRAHLLEQRDRLGIRLQALHRTVGEIDGRLARLVDRQRVGALDTNSGSSRCRRGMPHLCNGVLPLKSGSADVEAEFLDELTGAIQPPGALT